MASETNPFAVPGKEKELLAWIKSKVDNGRSRMPDVQMRNSMAFVLGHQWSVWDRSSGRFETPRPRSNDPNPPVRITANKIGAIVERSIAKLTKAAPMPQARPVSDGDDDKDTARVATRLLEHELDRLQWDSFLTEFYFWPVTLGYSYIHVFWDPDSGPDVGEVDNKPVKRGEIKLEKVPAFELAVDPSAKTMEDALWADRKTSWSKEAVWNKWGVQPEGAESGRSLADDVYALGTTDMNFGAGQRNKDNSEYVYVHQFWMKPCRAAPKGLVITYCGNTVLEKKETFPYDHAMLPFIQADLLPGLGTREGRTWVNDLIPLQIDYNDARSREATIRRLLTPKILAPSGSIDPQRVSARVEIIPYAPTGEKPSMMIPDSGWLAQFEEGMNRADLEMGDRAGQSDASAGRAHASQPAASILALQEADDTKLAISIKQLNAFIEKTGWQILRLIKQFWTEDRTVRTWSDQDGALEMYHYSNADVAEQLDVHISSESGVPRSQASRAQLALDLNARGIPPFTDPIMLMKFIDMPGADLIMDALNIDTRQAHRENGWLINGNPVAVNHFDKHFVHLMEHNNMRKSTDYEQASPQVKAQIDAHCSAHEEVISGLQANNDFVGLTMAGMPMGEGGGNVRENINYKDLAPNQQAALGMQAGIPPADGPSKSDQTGIGGPGQPGRVPGQSVESQMSHGATANK